MIKSVCYISDNHVEHLWESTLGRTAFVTPPKPLWHLDTLPTHTSDVVFVRTCRLSVRSFPRLEFLRGGSLEQILKGIERRFIARGQMFNITKYKNKLFIFYFFTISNLEVLSKKQKQ